MSCREVSSARCCRLQGERARRLCVLPAVLAVGESSAGDRGDRGGCGGGRCGVSGLQGPVQLAAGTVLRRK